MDPKQFKAFTPFINLTGWNHIELPLMGLNQRPAEEPGLTQWRSLGFMDMDGAENYHVDVQGAACLSCVQINERILPGSVLKEKIVARALAIADRTGRKPGKKEMAELREDVERELLPTAFIRRKLVPVMFVNDKVLIFTSSAKVCDDVASLLVHCIGEPSIFNPAHVEAVVEKPVVDTLTYIAKAGQTDCDEEGDPWLGTTNSMLLKGTEKQTIRIKDKDVNAADITNLLNQGYDVHALGVDYFDTSADVTASFILNHKLVVSGLKFADTAGGKKDGADFIATAWIVARTAHDVLDTIIAAMGGLRPVEAATGAADRVAPTGTEAMATEVEDDDEL